LRLGDGSRVEGCGFRTPGLGASRFSLGSSELRLYPEALEFDGLGDNREHQCHERDDEHQTSQAKTKGSHRWDPLHVA
jgi:hypothetical protein